MEKIKDMLGVVYRMAKNDPLNHEAFIIYLDALEISELSDLGPCWIRLAKLLDSTISMPYSNII